MWQRAWGQPGCCTGGMCGYVRVCACVLRLCAHWRVLPLTLLGCSGAFSTGRGLSGPLPLGPQTPPPQNPVVAVYCNCVVPIILVVSGGCRVRRRAPPRPPRARAPSWPQRATSARKSAALAAISAGSWRESPAAGPCCEGLGVRPRGWGKPLPMDFGHGLN